MRRAAQAAIDDAIDTAAHANTVRPIRDPNDVVLVGLRCAVREALPKSASNRARRALEDAAMARLEPNLRPLLFPGRAAQ